MISFYYWDGQETTVYPNADNESVVDPDVTDAYDDADPYEGFSDMKNSQVHFVMTIEGITMSTFSSFQAEFEASVATALFVDENDVNVEIILSRRRRVSEFLDLQVSVMTDDADAIVDTVSEDSFSSDVTSEFESRTNQSVTISNVSPPSIESADDNAGTILKTPRGCLL